MMPEENGMKSLLGQLWMCSNAMLQFDTDETICQMLWRSAYRERKNQAEKVPKPVQ